MERMIFRPLAAIAFCQCLAAAASAQQMGPYSSPTGPVPPGPSLPYSAPSFGTSGPLGPAPGGLDPYGWNNMALPPGPGMNAPLGGFPGTPSYDDWTHQAPMGWGGMPQYQSYNAKPPQNLKAYRPSIPGGVDMKKFAMGPSVNVREYPYLRRGQEVEGYVTAPGMEMPDNAPGTEKSRGFGDRLRRVIFPLGNPLSVLPKFPGLGR